MASLMDTVKSDFVGRVVVFIFTASTAGLLVYFDQRDMKKEMIGLKDEIREVKTDLKEYKQVVEAMKGLLNVVQDMKEEQKEIRKDQKEMQKEMYNFFQGYYHRVPEN